MAGRSKARASSAVSLPSRRPSRSPRCQPATTAPAAACGSIPTLAQVSAGQARSSTVRSAKNTSSRGARSRSPARSSRPTQQSGTRPGSKTSPWAFRPSCATGPTPAAGGWVGHQATRPEEDVDLKEPVSQTSTTWHRGGRAGGRVVPGLYRPARGGSEPQRGAGRLHRLVDHREQLGSETVEVDLGMQPGAECLDGPGRVVAAPVEAPIDGLLDAPAGRLEQAGDGQSGAGHCPARRLGADPTK